MPSPALKARLRALVSNPPIFVVARILARLGIRSTIVQTWETAHFVEAGEPARAEAIFRRFCNAAPEVECDPDRDLAHKSVMEVGCGRYGGLAPFVIRQNAERYVGIDPVANQDILHSNRVLEALRRSYFASVSDSAALSDRFRSNTRFLTPSSTADGIRPGSLDIVTSISCLEHIDDLEPAMASYSEKLKPGGCHLHLVNFSNHLDKDNPFGWMYEMEPDAFRRSYGRIVNLMRSSDMQAIFDRLGLKTTISPLDIRQDAVPTESLHPWWRERYGMEELAVRTAVLHAVKQS